MIENPLPALETNPGVNHARIVCPPQLHISKSCKSHDSSRKSHASTILPTHRPICQKHQLFEPIGQENRTSDDTTRSISTWGIIVNVDLIAIGLVCILVPVQTFMQQDFPENVCSSTEALRQYFAVPSASVVFFVVGISSFTTPCSTAEKAITLAIGLIVCMIVFELRFDEQDLCRWPGEH